MHESSTAPAIVCCQGWVVYLTSLCCVMTQYPLTLVWHILNQGFHCILRRLLAVCQDMDPFACSLLRAQLHSCGPYRVLAIDNSKPAASILGFRHWWKRWTVPSLVDIEIRTCSVILSITEISTTFEEWTASSGTYLKINYYMNLTHCSFSFWELHWNNKVLFV